MKRTKMNAIWHLPFLVALFWFLASGSCALAQTRINLIDVATGRSNDILLSTAQEQGLFTKHGVAVQILPVSEIDVPRLTGENPIGLIGFPAALLRAASGADLRILASFETGRYSDYLVARPDIKNPEDLRGKRLGVRVIGAGTWIRTILALEHMGLDPKRENISILSIGGATQIARALEAGTIDAAVLPRAPAYDLRARGFTLLLDFYLANIHGHQNGLVVTTTYFQEHPEVVEKVLAALTESAAFSLSPTNKSTVLHTIRKLYKLTDLTAAEEGYQQFLLEVVRKPYPSRERLRSMQRIMALHDPKVLDVRVEDLLEDRFVRKLDESGVIDRLYSSYGVK